MIVHREPGKNVRGVGEESRKEELLVVREIGQLEDEMRLAMHHAGIAGTEIHHLRHMGGILPADQEIYDTVRAVTAVEQ